MRINKSILIGSLVVLGLVAGALGLGLGIGCSSGWIELKMGNNYLCEAKPVDPCPNPADCVKMVAKLVTVEDFQQARLEYTNRPDVAELINPVLGKLFNEKFIVITHGTVVAGFDLEKITEADVWSDGKKIIIQLQPPEILYDPIIDPASTQIIADKGLCPDLICPKSIELAGTMLEDAQYQMRANSIQNSKILERSAISAKEKLKDFFKLLGYEEVEVTVDQYP